MADANILPLITYIRHYGNAATDDTFNGVTYWTDDQLEEVLLNRGKYGSYRFTPATLTAFNTTIPKHWWLRLDFTVYDDNNNLLDDSTYSYNEKEGALVFTTEVDFSYVTALGYAVNMWDSLADLWDIKAAQRSDYINFRAGHNVMNLREDYEHCVNLRDYYRNKTVRRWKRA